MLSNATSRAFRVTERLPGHVMRISVFPICEASELGLDSQLDELDLIDSRCERCSIEKGMSLELRVMDRSRGKLPGTRLRYFIMQRRKQCLYRPTTTSLLLTFESCHLFAKPGNNLVVSRLLSTDYLREGLAGSPILVSYQSLRNQGHQIRHLHGHLPFSHIARVVLIAHLPHLARQHGERNIDDFDDCA
jgi:hypothetical protein